MRALFIGPNLAAGGAERQWSILLPELRNRGIDARLIALDGSGPFEQPLRGLGVPVDVVYMRHRVDLLRLGRSEIARRFRPDVIITRGVSGLYVGQALAVSRRAAHVYNDHRGAGLALSSRRESMMRLIAKHLDLVIAVSTDQIAAWLGRGCPPHRIVVVPNGVTTPSRTGSKLELRRQMGIPESAFVALSVATLRPEKRISDFVRAALRARESEPSLVAMIAGDGPDRQTVEAAAMGDEGIRLLGHREDVGALLQAADVFVLSSGAEAVPMAILEAMAAGLPVLATDVGGIPDVVAHGETGLLVAPGDTEGMAAALTSLAADQQMRFAMGTEGARRHRRQWHADAMIDAYATILEKLVLQNAAP
jgi:glycosyltransferase involved in cell wall biosynthesis